MAAAKKKKNEEEDDDLPQTSRPRGGEEEEGSQEKQGFRILDYYEAIKTRIEQNPTLAMIIGGVVLLILIILLLLFVWHIVSVRNRPTIEQSVEALEFGAYTQARVYADSVLRYAKPDEKAKRSIAFFVNGTALCLQTDLSFVTEKKPYYLTAANYLQEARALGFPDAFQAEGLYYLGKTLYFAENIPQAIEALREAEPKNPREIKNLYWFLANAYGRTSVPDYNLAFHYCNLYLNSAENSSELDRACLLQSSILLRLGRIDEATKAFDRVPIQEELKANQEFVAAQILIEEARNLRKKGMLLEKELHLSTSLFETPAAVPKEEPSTQPGTGIEMPETPLQRGLFEETEPKTSSENEVEDFFDPYQKEQSGLPGQESGETEPTLTPTTEPTIEPTTSPNSAPLPPPNVLTPSGSSISVLHPRRATSIPVFEAAEDALPRTVSFVRGMTGNRESNPAPSGLRRYPVVHAFSQQAEPYQIRQMGFQEPKNPDEAESPVPEQTEPGEDPRLSKIRNIRDEAVGKYQEAVLRLEMAKLADAGTFEISRQANLLQGMCYEEMGDYSKAQNMYRFTAETFPETSEEVAADFLWAEVERKQGHFERSLAAYYRSVQKLKRLDLYLNPLLPRENILARAATSIAVAFDLKDFEEGFQLISIFGELLPKATTARLCAVGYERWGRDLRNRANAVFFEERENLQQLAEEKFRSAGRWYRELAQIDFDSPEFVERLWSSAENYRAGKDYLKAIPMYREYLKNEIVLRQAETLAILGQMDFELDLLDQSIEMFEEFIVYHSNHPLIYRVRLIKSYAHAEKKEPKIAEVLLLENLSGVLAPEAAEYRDSLFALGKMYYTDGDREKAIETLEDAILLHPEAIQAPEGYYMIGQSYLSRIEGSRKIMESTNLRTTRERASLETQKARQMALENFHKARDLLIRRADWIVLSQSERMMQMICYFEIAKLQLELGRLEEALASFNAAQTRYQNRPETLDALIQIALIYRQLNQPEKASETIQRGKVLLQTLSETKAFPPGYRFNEQEWSELLNWQAAL